MVFSLIIALLEDSIQNIYPMHSLPGRVVLDIYRKKWEAFQCIKIANMPTLTLLLFSGSN
ncbi:hypothetical protein T06_16954 [Trichinella sp. T6]|nr:hypothetical protein T06_16954 [Trichinella sp. T6]